MKKKKKLRIILSVLILLIAVGVSGFCLDKKYKIKDKIYLAQNVELTNTHSGYYTVNNKKDVSIYNLNYQNTVSNKIKKQKKKDSYTEENPLFILNPYGTNKTGLYVYFQTSNAATVEYTIHVDDSTYTDYSNTLASKKAENVHEGQIIGLIQGMKNKVTIQTKDNEGNVLAKHSFTLTIPKISTLAPLQIEKQSDLDSSKLSNGLYTLLGYDFTDKREGRGIYFYDNNGILRADIPVKDGHPDYDAVFVGNKLFYPINKETYCLINSLGKIEKTFRTPGYELHHDLFYADDDKMVILASKKGVPTNEDMIITLDLKKGTVSNVLDLGTLMPDIKKRAIIEKGKRKLDWIHINTVQVADGKDFILSSRETSSILRINDVYTKPYLAYIISDGEIWKGTKYESLVLKKEGNFVSQAGQHTVTYEKGKDGNYNLSMFNNNYGGSITIPSIDWSLIPNVNLDKFKGTYSEYLEYEVDEKNKTYKLVNRFHVPYSGIVSSTQKIENNVVVCSGLNNTFGEYTNEGELLVQFKLQSKLLTYRTFKYTMNGFWF